ncbi:MAG: hypothetical protein WCA46_18415 [Actinocatenispora sp.]
MSAICGVVPRVGETVLVGPSAGPHFETNYWLEVTAVRPSGQQGWIYLHGTDHRSDKPVERTLFVRIEGLVIRR